MKVVCIDNEHYRTLKLYKLTIGKVYDVLDTYERGYGEHYLVYNDSDSQWGYPVKMFKLLEEIRNERIATLLLSCNE